MTEYTPTDQDVETDFSQHQYHCVGGITPSEAHAEFRRWLSEHDRQVQAEALEQLVERVTDYSLVQVFGGEKFVSVPLLVSEAQAIREARNA